MNVVVELTQEILGTIRESLANSQDRIRNASGTPFEVRQANLARIDEALGAIRTASTQLKD